MVDFFRLTGSERIKQGSRVRLKVNVWVPGNASNGGGQTTLCAGLVGVVTEICPQPGGHLVLVRFYIPESGSVFAQVSPSQLELHRRASAQVTK